MKIRSIRFAAAIFITSLAISGCGLDGPAAATPQDAPVAETAPVTTPPAGNGGTAATPPAVATPAAMAIAGTPAGTLAVGQPYSFQATASTSTAVTFSIVGKPGWATFDAAIGRLRGTPTSADVGNYAGIVITANNGVSSASLRAFAINVVQTATGSATLSWTPPTTNDDGSALSNLAGYKIYFGSDPASLVQSVQVTNPGLTSYVISNLGVGTTYFAMTAYTTAGAESERTPVGSTTI